MPEQPTDPGLDTIRYAAAGDLTAVRAFVTARASAVGLPPERVEMLTLAVSELATNTLQHTTGAGLVRLRAGDGQLVCDVVDTGSMRSFGRTMPAADAMRGRGLAIVERICDLVDVAVVPEGTRVRVRLNL